MITDCCTFLMEYFVTGNPLIRLVSKKAPEYNINSKEVIKNYYSVESISELEKTLSEVLIQNKDSMRKQRVEASNQFRQNATENIITDLLNQF